MPQSGGRSAILVRMGWALPPTGLVGALMAFLLVTSCGPGGSSDMAAAVPGYRVARDLPMAGGVSRWGYQLLDGPGHRLYVAHQGAGEVVVVDTAQQRVTATVRGVQSVHGLSLARDMGRLYAAATGASQVAVIDVASSRVVDRVPAGGMPDGVVYVAEAARVFVSDEAGPGDVVIDARTNTRLPGVDLGADIGDSQFDPWNGLVLVAVGSSQELAAIDPRTGEVVRRYALPGCQQAQGVQVDSSANRAFVACQGNARLLTLDLDAGGLLGVLSVASGPDVLALDPVLHRLYVAAESGILTVVDVGPPTPRRQASGYAGPNAHSVAVDPDTHIVYLPLTSVGGRPVLRELCPL
jgi:YVTN family beta-propeller protein